MPSSTPSPSAEAMASASTNGAHYDGVIALGTSCSLLTAVLATIEAAERSIQSMENQANALPAGPQKVEAKKKARLAAEFTAQRSRTLRPRFAVLLGVPVSSHFSGELTLAARCLRQLDAGMAKGVAIGGAEADGGKDDAPPIDDSSGIDAPYAKPLGTKTKALMVCGATSADAGRIAADAIFGGAHFLLTHGASASEMPTPNDAPTMLKVRNFIKVGMPDELIAGCSAWYEHRRLGWLSVTITRVDYQGVADGGATYCIKAAELDGEVETVRTRLRRPSQGTVISK